MQGRWPGFGALRDASSRIEHLLGGPAASIFTAVIADGVLAMAAVQYTNMVAVPTRSHVAVGMTIDIFALGVVETRGHGLDLELCGEGRDVEPCCVCTDSEVPERRGAGVLISYTLACREEHDPLYDAVVVLEGHP